MAQREIFNYSSYVLARYMSHVAPHKAIPSVVISHVAIPRVVVSCVVIPRVPFIHVVQWQSVTQVLIMRT